MTVLRADTVPSPAAVTVIVALPVPIALTRPVSDTVATPAWLVVHVYGPMARVLLSVSWAVWPGVSESVGGDTLNVDDPPAGVPTEPTSGFARSSQAPAMASAANPSATSELRRMPPGEA